MDAAVGFVDLGALKSKGSGSGESKEVIDGVLPVLPLRDTVAFPDTIAPLAVGQPRSIQLINDVLSGNRQIALLASKSPDSEEPGAEDLYQVGVYGTVARMIKVPDGTLRILVQCGDRARVSSWVSESPYLVAKFEDDPDTQSDQSTELSALVHSVQKVFSKIVDQAPYLPEELQLAVANVEDSAALSHLIAGALKISTAEKQALLEERDVSKRLRRISKLLAAELEVITLGSKIQSQVQEEVDKGQREYFLRQQLKAIQTELGEIDTADAELDDLREKLDQAELPEDVQKAVDRELGRLAKTPEASAEHGVIRTYLEWIASLPWSNSTKDNLNLKRARRVLDEDHYGISQVKDRIVEFLAVKKLKPDARGSILCLVGPPGVGKTSLGRSIAKTLDRKFERLSVGGVRDESEIRGHRRTYIGAMPGQIARALRDAESKNPLIMIDEVDKIGADYRGDPASALLEVLDPEQNSTFRDHYLDVPFDLSDVLFIATANTLDTVPGPLRDRMEVVRLSGYSQEEKLEIARRYLVPRQIERNGLKPNQIKFTVAGLKQVISEYTREAGVRELEREIGRVCRKVAKRVAEGSQRKAISVTAERVTDLLGRRKFYSDGKRQHEIPGVATGLAWTEAGGDVLQIEATAMSGSGKLTLTGQLGDVMQESAQTALSWVRANIDQIDAERSPDWFSKHDIHLHVPAGAVPKDGPSAGITLATALVSLLTGRAVRRDTAMTGELTLTGEVLPIGGLKEKVLAAQRVKIKRIIAPKLNSADLDEIPDYLLRKVELNFVDSVTEVFELALRKNRSKR